MGSHRAYLVKRNLYSLGVASTMAMVAVFWLAPARAAECSVTDSASSGYSVEICVEVASGDLVLTDDAPISATVTVKGVDPGVRQMRFYLSDEYILTDFDEPYEFVLPSRNWVDGVYLLEAEALMRDDATTQRTGVVVELATGTSVPPVNTNRFMPAVGTDPADGTQFIVAATGDGPDGGVDTEAVVSLIQNKGANLLLYLGDVYEKGTKTEFFNWYGSDGARWGALRAITNPSLGNHEIVDDVTTGYDDYWDNIPRFYSFDANGWHFVSLDSERLRRGDPEQLTWLRRDLGTNTEACTVVFFHHPVLSIGPQGDSPRLSGVWAELVDAGVDAVLTAHDHNYQRWTTLDRNLSPD
ncbi:MAG: metallophosphoesterase, partial [Acidimicrobiales bacterium]